MPQPYNYALNQINPAGGLLMGLKAGREAKNLRIAEAQQQQKLKRQAELDNELAVLSDNPSVKGIVSAMIKNPQLSDKFKVVLENMSESEKTARIGQASRAYSAIKAGKPEYAIKSLNEEAEAYENSGRPDDAKALRDQAKLIELNPKSAEVATGMFLSTALGHDKFSENFETISTTESNIAATEAETALKTQQAEQGPEAFQTEQDYKKSLIKETKARTEVKVLEKALKKIELGVNQGDDYQEAIKKKKELADKKIALDLLDIENKYKAAQKTSEGKIANQQEVAAVEKELRESFMTNTGRNFQKVQANYLDAMNTGKTGAGALNAIVSFYKIKDPGSTVTGGEVKSLKAGGDLTDKAVTLINALGNDGALSGDQMIALRSEIKKAYENRKKEAMKQTSSIVKSADDFGLNIERIIPVDFFNIDEKKPNVITIDDRIQAESYMADKMFNNQTRNEPIIIEWED